MFIVNVDIIDVLVDENIYMGVVVIVVGVSGENNIIVVFGVNYSINNIDVECLKNLLLDVIVLFL